MQEIVTSSVVQHLGAHRANLSGAPIVLHSTAPLQTHFQTFFDDRKGLGGRRSEAQDSGERLRHRFAPGEVRRSVRPRFSAPVLQRRIRRRLSGDAGPAGTGFGGRVALLSVFVDAAVDVGFCRKRFERVRFCFSDVS